MNDHHFSIIMVAFALLFVGVSLVLRLRLGGRSYSRGKAMVFGAACVIQWIPLAFAYGWPRCLLWIPCFAGSVCNATALACNGWQMPVALRYWNGVGSPLHKPQDAETRCEWLIDQLPGACSIGDYLLFTGPLFVLAGLLS